jgi:hypothetical protein
MLFMSCIPAIGKAGSAALWRNPGVLGSPVISTDFKMQLKETGDLGILQAGSPMGEPNFFLRRLS